MPVGKNIKVGEANMARFKTAAEKFVDRARMELVGLAQCYVAYDLSIVARDISLGFCREKSAEENHAPNLIIEDQRT